MNTQHPTTPNGQVDRRSFLKWSAAGATTALGLGWTGSVKRAEAPNALSQHQANLSLDLWRVRPGGLVPIQGQGALSHRRVLIVALEEEGKVSQVLGQTSLIQEGEGWRGEFKAPPDPLGDRETYQLAVVWPEGDGVWRCSNAVEVVCAPFYVGM